ncbi:MAG: hypothetical protein IT270_09760, partial [Saprospiraceae bacterium]|nr:hypothetical protein [Saprospiraceae bacterium]
MLRIFGPSFALTTTYVKTMATTSKKTTDNGATPATPTSPTSGSRIITLDEFIIRSEKDFDFATGELTGLLRDIGV